MASRVISSTALVARFAVCYNRDKASRVISSTALVARFAVCDPQVCNTVRHLVSGYHGVWPASDRGWSVGGLLFSSQSVVNKATSEWCHTAQYLAPSLLHPQSGKWMNRHHHYHLHLLERRHRSTTH